MSLVGIAILALMALPGDVAAQGKAPATADAPPAKVQELLNLLSDPAVHQWIEQHGKSAAATPAASPDESDSMSGYAAMRMAAIHDHVAALAKAIPDYPAELMRAGARFSQEFRDRGILRMLLLIAGFAALGFGAEQLYHRIGARIERWIVALPLDTVEQRLRAMAIRLAYGTGMVAAFAIGSVGAFLALDWPPLLREIVLGYLLAFLCLRLGLIATRFVLAPGGERFRILPMTTPAAWFWHRRLGFAIGWFAFGWVTLGLLRTLGMTTDARRITAYVLGIGLVAIALESVWRRPRPAGPERQHLRHHAGEWLLSTYAVLLWLLWVIGAMPSFWLAVVVVGVPAAIGATRRAIDHVLRPPGADGAEEVGPGVVAASVARALRGFLIAAGALLLTWAWGLDLMALTSGDTMTTHLLRGMLQAVVILLLADFAWHVAKAVIDRKLVAAEGTGLADSDETRHQARLRTLLPILRNMLFIVLLVMAVLMALSALGIEVGPLIAGAGVVGVAVGFGAQTLVRDVISGIFFVLDDAFRVGEYIQTGNYKGTVESFSLRSVKLRHHRGPLYTVPFGVLGAVQNMSRDWVIDKLSVGVTYDTDLDKVRKLVKQVGKELLEDPELAPHIIETLKLQGVEQFGDYAIEMRMKMKTKPGEQFVIRRRAYHLIKKLFDTNGIKFAYPTVQVAGGDATTGAVAQQALELARPPSPAA
jgi:small-conductance mechanosensitive channel